MNIDAILSICALLKKIKKIKLYGKGHHQFFFGIFTFQLYLAFAFHKGVSAQADYQSLVWYFPISFKLLLDISIQNNQIVYSLAKRKLPFHGCLKIRAIFFYHFVNFVNN